MADEPQRCFSAAQDFVSYAHPLRKLRNLPCCVRGAIFAGPAVMAAITKTSATLRAEASLLTTAGVILLAIGFPLTMVLAFSALSPDGVPPILPIVIGFPPLLLGYLACHFASRRMELAKELEAR
jgi:hypothetical protein